MPDHFALSQNYPNPMNPSTTISFNLPVNHLSHWKCLTCLGREVASIISQELPAGTYARQWNAGKDVQRCLFLSLAGLDHLHKPKRLCFWSNEAIRGFAGEHGRKVIVAVAQCPSVRQLEYYICPFPENIRSWSSEKICFSMLQMPWNWHWYPPIIFHKAMVVQTILKMQTPFVSELSWSLWR